jgi:uncharacterized membrane protein
VADARNEILDWSEQGRIAPGRLRAALEAGGALPTVSQWRRFLDRVLLWMGSVMLASAAIFFFAFNWDQMGRLAKIGLVEAFLVAALVLLWRLGLERASGKATLFAAALLASGLLALIGQIYQTGADPWELFAVWAAAILPWALVARLAPLWVLWLALLNLAASLYYATFGILFGVLFAPERLAWMLFSLNTAALVVWEGCAFAGLAWLRERWSVRIVATASGAFATWLALHGIFEGRGSSGLWGLPAWLLWLGGIYAVYRHRVRDVYVLAGGVLSVIVVITCFMGKQTKLNDAGAFLFIGLVIIGLSAAGGWWLKNVVNEQDREGA